MLPHWSFKTEDAARGSSSRIYESFESYMAAGNFLGADMARKFLQMGWTRARRHVNHKGERKYDRVTKAELPRTEAPEKAATAVFYERYVAAADDNVGVVVER